MHMLSPHGNLPAILGTRPDHEQDDFYESADDSQSADDDINIQGASKGVGGGVSGSRGMKRGNIDSADGDSDEQDFRSNGIQRERERKNRRERER